MDGIVPKQNILERYSMHRDYYRALLLSQKIKGECVNYLR